MHRGVMSPPMPFLPSSDDLILGHPNATEVSQRLFEPSPLRIFVDICHKFHQRGGSNPCPHRVDLLLLGEQDRGGDKTVVPIPLSCLLHHQPRLAIKTLLAIAASVFFGRPGLVPFSPSRARHPFRKLFLRHPESHHIRISLIDVEGPVNRLGIVFRIVDTQASGLLVAVDDLNYRLFGRLSFGGLLSNILFLLNNKFRPYCRRCVFLFF